MNPLHPLPILQWIKQEQSLSLQCFLVLDGAKQPDLQRILYKLEGNPNFAILFHGTPLSESSSISPLLIAIKDSSPILAWFLAEQSRLTRLGMLVSSSLSLDELASIWSQHLFIPIGETEKALYRFYDPHVFSLSLQQPNNAVIPYLFTGIFSACVYNHYDIIRDVCIYARNTDLLPTPQIPLHMSWEQWDTYQELEERSILIEHIVQTYRPLNTLKSINIEKFEVTKNNIHLLILPPSSTYHIPETLVEETYYELSQFENKYDLNDINSLLLVHKHWVQHPRIHDKMESILSQKQKSSQERAMECLKIR